MKKEFHSVSLTVPEVYADFEVDVPDVCPRCNLGIDAKIVSSYFFDNSNHSGIVTLTLFCPRCKTFFYCDCVVHGLDWPEPELWGTMISPTSKKLTDFSAEINGLSPEFVSIYHQAESAENAGLDKVCGMAYRKALEFLVKDYAIHLHPDDADTIKAIPLSNCISDHIDNPKIQTLSKASAWIGNDETHYVRKHETYSVAELKSFIHAIVTFIDANLAVEAAVAFVSQK